MSTRYVWAIYTTDSTLQHDSEHTIIMQSTAATVFLCNSYQVEIVKGQNSASNAYPLAQFVPIGGITATGTSGQDKSYSTNTYKYLIFNGIYKHSSGAAHTSSSRLLESDGTSLWHVTWGSSYVRAYTNDSATDYNTTSRFNCIKGSVVKGNTLYSYKSSASKSLEDGAFLSDDSAYWRQYLGSDNIDPTAVTYSTSDLQAGESVTIRVTPRTPAYGGTVYYQYQYSTNGSTWTNIGSKTTSTSAAVAIPAGATQFQARVLASDNYGFTSSDYITGPSLGVSVLKAYVGVSSKARAVTKIYVGVNGKAREVVKGYVGVDGKAKKFL